ncbi:MAG: PQQ-binding-like beta-propeller repeat protein [Verrucomicrobiales bacterium]|nr:PQQ-binding-like beta-propeller repeat protein [Verrucomicrobiales bacterium]
MKRRVRLPFLSLAAALASAWGADWPQFRGPHGNGASDETGFAWRLDAAENLAWQVALPGRGLSSPIVVGGRVFVTAASGPRQEELRVLCFQTIDGTLRWERRFWATGRTMCHPKTCVAAPTPASDGERVYALFSSCDLICLNFDGQLVWFRGLTHDYPNVSNSLGMSSSLVAADGVVVAQVETDTESYALGLDGLTGVNRWRLDRPRLANWTSPVLLPAEGGPRQVALQSGRGVAGVEVRTGRAVWNYGEGASTIASSAMSGPRLFVPSFGLTALDLDAAGGPPRQAWRAGNLRPATSSPAVLGDRVYVINDAGVLSCGDAANGRRVWQVRLNGPISASPVAAEGHLVAISEKGVVQVVDLSGSEGEVVAERDLQATILGTPALANGALYVRSDGSLWKFAAENARRKTR